MGDIFSGTDSGGLWLDVPPPVVQVNFPIEVVPGSKVAHTALCVQLPAPAFLLFVFPFPDFGRFPGNLKKAAVTATVLRAASPERKRSGSLLRP